MTHNVFTFGNRYFIQTNGTAMGTSCACMYATIYYSYHEECCLMNRPYIHFYRRLIDDAFVILKTATAFSDLTRDMNDFGPENKRLEWEAEPPSRSVAFLDLTITITDNGNIHTQTYQKPMNLYLYRPPTSCQPNTLLYSLIYGTIHRYFWQNTDRTDFKKYCSLFFDRLLARLHRPCDLHPLFEAALKKAYTSKLPSPKPTSTKTPKTDQDQRMLILHTPYHPQLPPRKDLRQLAQPVLQAMNSTGHAVFDRAVVALSKAPSIGSTGKKNQLDAAMDTTNCNGASVK